MAQSRSHLVLLAAAILGLSATAQAQNPSEPLPVYKGRIVKLRPNPVPFDINSPVSRSTKPLEYRASSEMTERDREVEANAESSIGEHARFADLEFNDGLWTYEQIVCRALPQHVFLRFQRSKGSSDVSMFTAAIPRNGQGIVRIIPIQKRGYSLFSPAPVNSLTISAFNHIRAEENPDKAPEPDWFGMALCYSALAGGHPQAAAALQDSQDSHATVIGTNPLIGSEALLELPSSGGPTISFTDTSASSHPVEWAMKFDTRGRLLKASRSAAPLIKVQEIRPVEVNVIGAPKPVYQPTVTAYVPKDWQGSPQPIRSLVPVELPAAPDDPVAHSANPASPTSVQPPAAAPGSATPPAATTPR